MISTYIGAYNLVESVDLAAHHPIQGITTAGLAFILGYCVAVLAIQTCLRIGPFFDKSVWVWFDWLKGLLELIFCFLCFLILPTIVLKAALNVLGLSDYLPICNQVYFAVVVVSVFLRLTRSKESRV
jgi:hypothetical protein